ncbi:MAG: PEP-CTERM sorting domain-containing protein [Bryobacteraceae bacterium]
MKLFQLAALVVITAGFGVAAPFTNGSFESSGGAFTPPANVLGNGDTFVTGWVHDGPGALGAGEFYTDGVNWGVVAGQGTYYVGFGAGGLTGGTLSQTFDTTIGTTYFVNYLLSTQEFDGIPPIQVAVVEALDGSTVLASVSNSFNQGSGIWNSGLTLTFTATSSSTTLRFTDATSPANSPPVNWGLDAVSVAPVPEPTTFGLVGLGLALCAWRKRRA